MSVSALTLHTLRSQEQQRQFAIKQQIREKEEARQLAREEQQYQRMIADNEFTLKQKQMEFDRHLKIAELQAKTAAAMGKPAPTGYKSGGVQETADATYDYQQALPQMFDPQTYRAQLGARTQLEAVDRRHQNKLVELEAGTNQNIRRDEAKAARGYPEHIKTQAGKMVFERLGLRPGDEGFGEAWEAAQQRIWQQENSRAKNSASKISMNTGATPLTTGAETATQNKVLNARQRLAQLAAVERSIAKVGGWNKIGSYQEQIGDLIGGVKSRLEMSSPKEQERLRLRTDAISKLTAVMSDALHDLSGAAINEHEMERLKRSIPTENDAGPQLQAKYETMRDNLANIAKVGLQALEQGLVSGDIIIDENGRIHIMGVTEGAPPGENEEPLAPEQQPAAPSNERRALFESLGG